MLCVYCNIIWCPRFLWVTDTKCHCHRDLILQLEHSFKIATSPLHFTQQANQRMKISPEPYNVQYIFDKIYCTSTLNRYNNHKVHVISAEIFLDAQIYICSRTIPRIIANETYIHVQYVEHHNRFNRWSSWVQFKHKYKYKIHTPCSHTVTHPASYLNQYALYLSSTQKNWPLLDILASSVVTDFFIKPKWIKNIHFNPKLNQKERNEFTKTIQIQYE